MIKQFVVRIDEQAMTNLKSTMADWSKAGSEYMHEMSDEDTVRDAIICHQECDWGGLSIDCFVKEIDNQVNVPELLNHLKQLLI